MIYAVEFVKSAERERKKLPPDIRLQIDKALYKLSQDPRKGNVRSMVGSSSWRMRVGDYRVVYDIHDKEIIILILRVRHRKDVYRK